jgi:hypothetical protein
MADKWSKLHRSGRLARVLWSQLAETDLRSDMERRAASEQKRAPYQQPLLSDHTRGACSPLGGQAVGWPKKGK